MPHYFQSYCDHSRMCTFRDVEKRVITVSAVMLYGQMCGRIDSDCRAPSTCERGARQLEQEVQRQVQI